MPPTASARLVSLLVLSLAAGLAGAQGLKPALVLGDSRFDFPLDTVTISRDGTLLAAANIRIKAEVVVVDVSKRRVLHRLTGHDYYANHLAFSPDGTKLYTGGRPAGAGLASPDNQLIVWETRTGKRLADFQANDWELSADGRLLITLENRKSPIDPKGNTPPPRFILQFRDAAGKAFHQLSEAGTNLSSMRLSPDGKTLAIADRKLVVRLIDVIKGKEVRRFQVPKEKHDGAGGASITHIAWSNDGKMLATVKDAFHFDRKTRRLTLWNAGTGKEVRQLPPADGNVSGLEFARLADRLVVTDRQGGWRVYDTKSGKVVREPKGLGLPGGVALALYRYFADPDRRADPAPLLDDLWDRATGTDVASGRMPDRFLELAVSPDSKRLASGEQSGTIRIWDTRTGKELRRFQPKERSSVYHFAFTATGKRLVGAAWDGTVRLWDVEKGTQVDSVQPVRGGSIQSLALSADGRLAVGTMYQLFLGRVEGDRIGTLTKVLDSKGISWTGLRFTRDGKTLFAGHWLSSGDDGVRAYDLKLGKVVRAFRPPGDTANFDVSPDGKRLVTFSRGTQAGAPVVDRFIRLWDAETGKERKRIVEAIAPYYGLRFAPDGRRLGVQHIDGVGVWDVETGKNVAFFAGAGRLAAFAPDGRRLYCLDEKRITAWELPR